MAEGSSSQPRETRSDNPRNSSPPKLGEEYDEAKAKWAPYIGADGSFDVKRYTRDRHAGMAPVLRLFSWVPGEDTKRQQDRRCAEQGLAWYNRTNNVEFELVETVGSSACIDQGGHLLYHANFKAKPKVGDSEVKLFFAEIQSRKTPADSIITCCILEDDGSTSAAYPVMDCPGPGGEDANANVLNGCRNCVSLRHPRGNFNRGLRPFLLRAPLEQ